MFLQEPTSPREADDADPLVATRKAFEHWAKTLRTLSDGPAVGFFKKIEVDQITGWWNRRGIGQTDAKADALSELTRQGLRWFHSKQRPS
ncbi:unannotated protein [freshwater metagenome]|uniref:Unannotated protein n=1 Tax=freshwater metagenome TaxID=449393 RepID=A0A6J7EYH7_9ZZZZ